MRARFDAALIRLELGETERAHRAFDWIVREHPGDGPAGRSLRFLMEARAEAPISARVAFLEELTHQLAEPEVYRDPDMLRAVEADRAEVRRQIEALYATWEQAAEEAGG